MIIVILLRQKDDGDERRSPLCPEIGDEAVSIHVSHFEGGDKEVRRVFERLHERPHAPVRDANHILLRDEAGHARKVMHSIWGLPQAMFTKCIVVVDEDVDVHDTREVVWKALNHIDPERDIEFALGPIDILDHSSRLPGYGSHMGIDATKKWKDEGFTRPWPDEIRMTPEIRAMVDKKWNHLGI